MFVNLEILKDLLNANVERDYKVKGTWRDAGAGLWHTTITTEKIVGNRKTGFFVFPVQVLNPHEVDRAEAGVMTIEEAQQIVAREKTDREEEAKNLWGKGRDE